MIRNKFWGHKDRFKVKESEWNIGKLEKEKVGFL